MRSKGQSTGVPRRTFLKVSASAGGAALLGALGSASCHQESAAQGSLELGAWRARPGAQIPIVLRTTHGQNLPELPLHLCEVNAKGEVVARLGSAVVTREEVLREEALRGEATQTATPHKFWQWTGQWEVPAAGALRESFLLAAVFRTAQGQVLRSNILEVVCTPFFVGG